MTERSVNKWLCLTLSVLGISLIPMLLVALYSRPFADDFAYAVYTHTAWQESHSLFALIAAVARQVRETMTTWQGSFSAIVLFSLQPGIFGDRLYGFSTVILVAFFLLGHFVFFSAILYQDKKTSLIVSSVVCLILMQTLPHAFQGFYWWNGSSYYTLFYSLFLIQLAMLYRLYRFHITGWIRTTILACFLGFVLGGGNLVTALLNAEITVLWAVLAVLRLIRQRDRRIFFTSVRSVIAVMICTFAGFLLNVTAPGNRVRMETEAPVSAIEAIIGSFEAAVTYIGSWTTLATMSLLLLLIPFLWHVAAWRLDEKRTTVLGQLPSPLLLITGFCLFASCFTPTLYTMNEMGPRRIQNIRYDFFILLLVLMEYEGIYRVRRELRLTSVASYVNMAKFLHNYFVFMAVAGMILIGIYVFPRENRNVLTSVAAMRSLMIGEAQRYAAERDAWEEPLTADTQEVVLPALTDHPQPIYYVDFDITPDPEDYRNVSMEMYYGKDSVVAR